jgi:thiol:disulfide interchange protein DsbD
MNELRSALGFVLLATAVWLVWILGRAEGADAAALLLAGLVALGFGAWAFGRLQAHDVAARPFLALAAAGIVVVLGTGMVRTGGAPELPTVPWSQGVVAEQLDEGRPTFVYFTADWCLTCKVNERLVLADPRVHEAVERLGFTVVRGDWTRRDEALGAEIARLGRSGVPLYAVYGVTEPDAPELLPELLTVDRLLESLDAAAGKEGVTRVTSPQSVVSMEDGRVDTAMEVRP